MLGNTVQQTGKRLFGSSYGLALVLFVVCLCLIEILQPSYFRPANVANNLRSILPLVLVTAAQTVVVISGGIDLSVGTLLTLASVTMVQMFGTEESPGSFFGGLLAGLATALLAGAVNGFAVSYLRLQPIVATFATSFLWSGLALWVLPRAGGAVPEGLSSFARMKSFFGRQIVYGLILLALISIYGRGRADKS